MKVYKIETDRLIIRCYQPSDASLFSEAINTSLENLKLFMPWAKYEPTDLKEKEILLNQFKADFDAEKDFTFGIFNKQENQLIGSTGLHKRVGKNALEIGYWIHSGFLHKGFATEATKALTEVAFLYFNIKRVEIHCNIANIISQKIPEKLGFQKKVTKTKDVIIWFLTKEKTNNSLLELSEFKVFDTFDKEIKQ